MSNTLVRSAQVLGLLSLALCCLSAEVFAQADRRPPKNPPKTSKQTGRGEAATGGAAERLAGLVCVAASGLLCLATVGGATFGLIWLLRRQKQQARSGFEGGVRGAVASGVDDAFERHRRAKREQQNLD